MFSPTIQAAARRLELRIGRRAGKDTALALDLGDTTLQVDVTVRTPVRTPGVLDLVVVKAVQGAVTNSQNTVVQVGTARSSKNTTFVELESTLVSLDGNADRIES